MIQLYKQSEISLKNKKEKVWVWRNTQEKNMLNIKKFLINKKEENKKSKNNMKDLIVKHINNSNK